MCVIHLYQENEGIAGPMDKSGITTLVGFSLRENEREKENNIILTRTGYILCYYAMHFTVSFMRWPDQFITATIVFDARFFQCAQWTFRRCTCLNWKPIDSIHCCHLSALYVFLLLNSFKFCRLPIFVVFLRFISMAYQLPLWKRPCHSFITNSIRNCILLVLLVIIKY